MLRNENVLKFFKTAYCFTDSQRNTAYENWISENVKDKIVIDLGAGSGILCYLAVKYGAKKVYALERRGRLIHRMKETLGDTIEYIHADLLETELPECDIYLHEWLSSNFWNEKKFLMNFHEKEDKELEFGHILDLVEYAEKNKFIHKLYPNIVELSSIQGKSTAEWVDIELQSHGEHSRQFLQEHYGDLTKCPIYRNEIHDKKEIWTGHIKDLKYRKVDGFLGWKLSFDGKYELSNHISVSHWGLKSET